MNVYEWLCHLKEKATYVAYIFYILSLLWVLYVYLFVVAV